MSLDIPARAGVGTPTGANGVGANGVGANGVLAPEGAAAKDTAGLISGTTEASIGAAGGSGGVAHAATTTEGATSGDVGCVAGGMAGSTAPTDTNKGAAVGC